MFRQMYVEYLFVRNRLKYDVWFIEIVMLHDNDSYKNKLTCHSYNKSHVIV